MLEEAAARFGWEDPRRAHQTRKRVEQIIADCFKEQRAFVSDPSKRVAADPSRRAGKTQGVARRLSLSALRHGGADVWSTYTAITRQQAKDLEWGPLKEINRIYRLGAKPHESELTLTFPNGHRIKLFGADKLPELEKKRGYKVAEAALDESASFPPGFLRYYFDEILEPATADLDGTITMIGTPANHCTGPFYDACNGLVEGWSHHHWTMLQNPHISHAKRWLANLRKRRRWTVTNPIYLREYMGKWIRDLESVVYPYDAAVNKMTTLPRKQWMRLCGVDLGAGDTEPRTAFSVWFVSEDHPIAYLVRSYKTTDMTSEEIAGELKKLEREWGKFNVIVGDHGALGKAIFREVTSRYGIAVIPAEKTEKKAYIKLMQSDLKAGRIQVDEAECADWVDEAQVLQWDPDKPWEEDDRFPNHACDSALYPWRYALHWLHEEREEEPEKGSPEYYEKEADRWEDAAKKRVKERQDGPWWE